MNSSLCQSPRRQAKLRLVNWPVVRVLSIAVVGSLTLVGATQPATASGSYQKTKTVLSDPMLRTATEGWGSAQHIAYTGGGESVSVSAGRAHMKLSAAGSKHTVRVQYSLQDVEASYKVSVDRIPTSGSGIYSSIQLRDSSKGYYRAVVRVLPKGKAQLQLARWTPSGMANFGLPQTLPFTLEADQQISLKLRTTGNTSVNLQTKAWLTNSPEPDSWTAQHHDSSSRAITTGGKIGVTGFRANSTKKSARLSYDDLNAVGLTYTRTPTKPVSKPTVPTPTPVPAPPGSSAPAKLPGWGNPVWRDEFDGSLNRWTVRDDSTHGVLSYDRAIIKRENSYATSGLLHLTGKRMATPVKKSGKREFSTGYIDSRGKFSQKYGRWEMRAKLPLTAHDSLGIWPAFWLRPDDSATGGEIDIMEGYGTPITAPTNFTPFNRTEATLHYDQSGKSKTNSWIPVTPNLSDNFHTWAFEWTPEGMTWLFDGKAYKTVTRAGNPAYERAFETAAKFHIRLNMQYGSPYWGRPDPTNPTLTKDLADFQIDYVRVWKYEN